MVELIKFEPVTLARLDCIPTRRMGTRKFKSIKIKELP